jgi:hypothetical protein
MVCCSQVVQIGGHFLDLSIIVLLDFFDEASVLGQNEVNCGSLSSETSSSTDSVNVVLLSLGEFVVHDETDLLDIDTSGKEIGGDEHTDGSLSELLHDNVSLDLVHFSVDGGDGEFVFSHNLLQFFDLFLSVTVDKGLLDIEVGVQIQKDVHLPALLFDSDVILSDTIESQILTLDENLCGVSHEVLGKFKSFRRECCGEQSNLNITGEIFENVLDLFLETTLEHLISFIKNEKFEVVRLQEPSLHHVENATGGSNDNLDTTLENSDVFFHDGSSDASVDLSSTDFSNRVHNECDLHGELTGG